MKASDYVNTVRENEPATTDDVVDATGKSEGHVQKKLKELAEERPDVPLARERDGPGYVYVVEDEPTNEQGEQVETDSRLRRMPAVRGYDFTEHAVERPNEYFSSDGELRRLMARVSGRHRSEQPVRALVGGPTGSGKTTLAENVAAQEDAAFFEVAMRDDMSDSDLYGSPVLAGDETVWTDGPVTKALMASAPAETQVREGWVEDDDAAHDGPAVLLVDELNRAPAKAKNALFSALDYRARVSLAGPRGGEVIEGDALDLIVIASVNEGDEYHGTHRLDHAEASRWTNRYECDYLATYDMGGDVYAGVETEAELLVSRRDLPANVAESMVRVAADVRARAADPTNTTVAVGIPTRTVLAWAATALDYDSADIENALVEGAKDTVLSFYASPGDEDARDEVLSVIEDALNDAPLDPDEFEAFEADEVVRCEACSWHEPKPKAEDMGVMALMECPECGGDVRSVRR